MVENQKLETPLVLGGQGRSSQEVVASAAWLAVLFAIGLGILGGALCLGQ